MRSTIDTCWTARAAIVARGSLCLLGGVMFSVSAEAAVSHAVTPFIGAAYSYDDNVMRASGDAADKARADTSRQIEAGLLFDKTLGLQVLSGKAAVTQVSFNHLDQLNYNGKDLFAAWNWHLGNHVGGNLGASYVQVLAPYADFQSQERNLRVQRREFFDARWRLHPSWQVRGGVSGDKISYELPALRLSERTEDVIEAGVDYLVATGSTVGLQLRHLKSAYPKRPGEAGLAGDGSFMQDEVKAKIYWRYSATTQVLFLGGWAKRKHELSTSRDASGSNGRVKLEWAPLGKVRFSASAWREFAAVESAFVTSSLNKGGSLDSTWQPTAKLQLSLQLKGERRAFEGQPVPVQGLDMDDSTRRTTLAMSHDPLLNVQLGASLFHEARSGSAALGLGSYRASGAMLNANIRF